MVNIWRALISVNLVCFVILFAHLWNENTTLFTCFHTFFSIALILSFEYLFSINILHTQLHVKYKFQIRSYQPYKFIIILFSRHRRCSESHKHGQIFKLVNCLWLGSLHSTPQSAMAMLWLYNTFTSYRCASLSLHEMFVFN